MTDLIKTKISKGFQIVVPVEIREKIGAEPGDEIIWSIIGNDVFIRVKRNYNEDPIKKLIGKFTTPTADDVSKNMDKVIYGDQN